jgi:hypothetical protein
VIGVGLVTAMVVDLATWPDHNLPILCVVPVPLASFTEAALLLVSVSTLVILLDLVSALVSRPPLSLGPLAIRALLAVCYLALRVAGQRALSARRWPNVGSGCS